MVLGSMAEYRLLQPHERAIFSKTFEKAFGRLPDMNDMTAMCAWEDGEIVGFMGMYTSLVLDSMWVKDAYRGRNMCTRLIGAIRDLPWKFGRGCYFFSHKSSHEALARKFGARRSGKKLWEWSK